MILGISKDIFEHAGSRFASYYLDFDQNPDMLFQWIQNEYPNIQNSISFVYGSNEEALICNFWRRVKDIIWDNGDWQIFHELGEISLKVMRSICDKDGEASVLSDLGWLWMERTDFENARNYFDESLDLFRQLENPAGICATIRYRGVLSYRLGDFINANNNFESALQIATENNFSGMIAEIRNLQGSLARKSGDLTNALNYYEQARTGYEDLGDKWRLTAVLRNLARLYFKAGDYSLSKKAFYEVIELCKEIDRKDMLYGSQLGLAEVELKLGNTKDAHELAESARKGFFELGMEKDLEDAIRFSQEHGLSS
jgi:tetratricopeptide (TPR) repeat protein